MKARHSIIFLSLLLSALAGISSCVYPFEAELEGESGAFVIEGDILIGEVMKVNLSYTASVSNLEDVTYPESASVWVEDSNGASYIGKPSEQGEYLVDMTTADPGLQYRLRVTNGDTGNDYSSSWLKVCSRPVVDSLSYVIDRENARLDIGLSMHSEGDRYFRWTYEEDWEYHAQFDAVLEFLPPVRDTETWNNGRGVLTSLPYARNIYYCWNKHSSTEIMIFSTETQSENRFVDLKFRSISDTDIRVQSLYRIEVKLETITADAYAYWDNVKTNSEYNGSLFTPNPSEMAGNIKCLNDTTEMVFGFINAAQRDSGFLYFDNITERFYRDINRYEPETEMTAGEMGWNALYHNGNLPYEKDPENPSVSYWAPKFYVDCTCRGGNKNRPDFWPNGHI